MGESIFPKFHHQDSKFIHGTGLQFVARHYTISVNCITLPWDRGFRMDEGGPRLIIMIMIVVMKKMTMIRWWWWTWWWWWWWWWWRLCWYYVDDKHQGTPGSSSSPVQTPHELGCYYGPIPWCFATLLLWLSILGVSLFPKKNNHHLPPQKKAATTNWNDWRYTYIYIYIHLYIHIFACVNIHFFNSRHYQLTHQPRLNSMVHANAHICLPIEKKNKI